MVGLTIPFFLFAQDQGNKADREWVNEKWAMKFDENGDGKLDEQEKQIGDKAVRKWREGHKKKIDKHNHEDLRRKYNEIMKNLENGDKELVDKFDKNGNGQLDNEEKETAKREIRKFFKAAAQKGDRKKDDQRGQGKERWNNLRLPDSIIEEDNFDGVL